MLGFASSTVAQSLEFEQVGDQPIDAHDLDFDSDGGLWGSSAGSDFWYYNKATQLWEGPGNRGGDYFTALSPDTLLIATPSGVHRSIDGGEQWTVVLFEGGAFYEGSLEGPNNGVVLVGENNGGSGIAYSTDRGATFTEATFTVSTNTR
ncbi:MAG: hypothetical protein R3284_01900, partial [Rubricoccaceae bacterium]|nr:hypothetical protein [Rubricoccaceae bacterium]